MDKIKKREKMDQTAEESRCLPPAECWRGAKPSHAAKPRPLRNVSIGGAKAMIAVAAIGPIPGIVINRRAASSSLAQRAINASTLLPSESRNSTLRPPRPSRVRAHAA